MKEKTKQEPSNIEEIALELKSLKTSLQLRGLLPVLLFSITRTGGFPRGFTDTITRKREDNCDVVITSTINYELVSQEGDCKTYKITITVTAQKVCSPTSNSSKVRTTTHVTEKTFCGTDVDERTTGETKGFDDKETDTIKYKHGTKITVEQDGDAVTITVEYPDGTTATTSFP